MSAMNGAGNGSGDGSGNGGGDGSGDGSGFAALLGGQPFEGRLVSATLEGFRLLVGGNDPGFPDAWWSPAWRATLILADFASQDWRSVAPPAPDDSDEALRPEIKAMLGMQSQRAGRMPEIHAQANDFELYFLHLLMADQGRRPHTATLVHAGMAVGTMVAMYWKDRFKRARPAQRFPALMPAIPTPQHPSYPSGHALQSYLIALSLGQIFATDPNGTMAPRDAMRDALRAMADRIARNREIAGVHFPSDTNASMDLAIALMPLLLQCPAFLRVLDAARAEWPGLSVGAAIAWPESRTLREEVTAALQEAMAPAPDGSGDG